MKIKLPPVFPIASSTCCPYVNSLKILLIDYKMIPEVMCARLGSSWWGCRGGSNSLKILCLCGLNSSEKDRSQKKTNQYEIQHSVTKRGMAG